MPSAAPLNATIVRAILTMRATVWGRTANTGPYNNALKTGLACFLFPVSVRNAPTSSQRADLASLRTFMWDATYTLAEQGVQIEITSPAHYAGRRWNVQAGTQQPADVPGFSDMPVAIECDIRRAN